MKVKLISFGFKYGEPHQELGQDYRLIDCRGLKNPHNVTELKPLTGLDGKVQRYVESDVRFGQLQDNATMALKDGIVIAFGCYGGRHRSVSMAEMTAAKLKDAGHEVEIYHRELDVRKSA